MLWDCFLLTIGYVLGIAVAKFHRAYRESLVWKD